MDHAIALSRRLDIEPYSVSLSDLLLTELRIFRREERDMRDIVALLGDRPGRWGGRGGSCSSALITRWTARTCALSGGTCRIGPGPPRLTHTQPGSHVTVDRRAHAAAGASAAALLSVCPTLHPAGRPWPTKRPSRQRKTPVPSCSRRAAVARTFSTALSGAPPAGRSALSIPAASRSQRRSPTAGSPATRESTPATAATTGPKGALRGRLRARVGARRARRASTKQTV